jgi:hypothetical protein
MHGDCFSCFASQSLPPAIATGWNEVHYNGKPRRRIRFMNMKLWTQVVILLAMGLFTGSLAAQKNQKEPIRVFIFTAANVEGFADADQKQRSDSVEDLRKVLGKNALVQLVSQQGAADIALEVLGRGREENGFADEQITRYHMRSTARFHPRRGTIVPLRR